MDVRKSFASTRPTCSTLYAHDWHREKTAVGHLAGYGRAVESSMDAELMRPSNRDAVALCVNARSCD